MKMVLVRVAIDSGSGGMQGPLLQDGSFEYMPIPDRLRWDSQDNRYIYDHRGRGLDERKYGNTPGRHGRLLVEFFPAGRREDMARQSIHWDPEFETFTYGDPSRPKAVLARLCQGDMLVFYCGLQGWDVESPPALYLLGYFEVSRVVQAKLCNRVELLDDFGANYHVRHEAVFEQQKKDLILVKGGPGSTLFTKAW